MAVRKRVIEDVDSKRLADADELLQRLTSSSKHSDIFIKDQGRTQENRVAYLRFNSIVIWTMIAVLIMSVLWSYL